MSNSGRGHGAEQLQEDLHILPRRMEHFHHAGIGHQHAERRQIQPRCLCVHHRHILRAGQLHHAKLGPIGPLAHEFGIDGDKGLARQALAEGGKVVGLGDEPGGRKRQALRG